MQTAQLDGEGLAEQLAQAMPRLDPEEQHAAVTLYRLLAAGEPVARERLAEHAGLSAGRIGRLLDEQPGVYFDDRGRVVGFWGLALAVMPHRMRIDGTDVYGWCAWDTLFLPELIGTPVTVESPCPTTGETVRLALDPGGVRDVSPEAAVLSFLRPDRGFDSDTINSFCHYVRFFCSPKAAREWTASHGGTFVISIEDGFQIGRRTNRARFPAAVAAGGEAAATAPAPRPARGDS